MLRASFVIDYQNVHLTARDVFDPDGEAHDSLVDPVRLAKRALAERNARQREGYPHAELAGVSGLPRAPTR